MKRILSCAVVLLALAAIAVSVAPLGARAERLVYIGTYTTDTNANSTSKGIYAYRFDDATGALSPLSLAATTPSPSFLTASADGRFVFAVNELQNYQGEATGLVTSFSVDRASGKLTQLSQQLTKGAGPCYLILDKTGRFLAVANYTSGNFSLFPVGSDGKLQPASTIVAGAATAGPDGEVLKGLGHMVAFDTTNKFLVASDKGLNKLLVFKFDAANGMLIPNQPPSVSIPQPKSGPRHFVFDPKQQFVFSLAEQAATVTSFAWDVKAGTLAPVGAVSTRPEGVTSGSTAEIAMHPSGKFVYASNRSANSTIAVFKVGPNGALTLVEHASTRGATTRNFGIDPSGQWLIAANQGSGTLAVFRIDQNTGTLAPVGGLTEGIAQPVCVIFM